jgi:hypothetical protein
VRKTVQLSAAALRCASGANCVSYPALGEPSKISRGNPGPRCFACEKQRGELEVKVVAAKLKAAKHRQVKKPSLSEGYEPEVSRASEIRERRRMAVLTCERGLRSAIDSDDARLTRRWSRSLREAQARLLRAEGEGA